MSGESGLPRVLVIAHGHPDAGPGGAEIAAYNLFLGLKAHPGVQSAVFLARTADAAIAPDSLVRLADDEFLLRRDIEDWLSLRSATPLSVLSQFKDFLRIVAPDIVFLHHYVHLGIDVASTIRAVLPRTRIVLTLHDFIAICHNGGLMLKTGFSAPLCETASPDACGLCFPLIAAHEFRKRDADLKAELGHVDLFVTPSRFARERYAAWGLAADRITVIENGLDIRPPPLPPSRNAGPRDGVLRLGFFGQIREAKGLDVLLAALHRLAPQERAGLRLSINGSRLGAQSGWYRELVARLCHPLLNEGTVCWNGAYGRNELQARMAAIDIVVVPSIWWENSPLVIRESFAFGKPVIGSNLGGITEKVRDGIDGVLFAHRDALALAECVRGFLRDRTLLPTLEKGVRTISGIAEMATAYLETVDQNSRLYRENDRDEAVYPENERLNHAP